MNCPKCDADISESYEPDDPSVGVCGGWYCDACDLAIGEHEVEREPLDDDVPIMTAKEFLGDVTVRSVRLFRNSPASRATRAILMIRAMPATSGLSGSRDRGVTIEPHSWGLSGDDDCGLDPLDVSNEG